MRNHIYHSKMLFAGKQMRLIGGHVTAANAKLTKLPVQTYLTTNRRHVTKSMIDAAQKRIKQYEKDKKIIAHSPYVTHPWSANSDISSKSIDDIRYLSELCNQLNVPMLLVHLPAREVPLDDFKEVAQKIAEQLQSPCKILFENVPIQGDLIKTLHSIDRVLSPIFGENYGYCIDTAHAFVSGIPLSSAEDMQKFIKSIEDLPIRWIHLNGNKTTFNSKRDKHTFPLAYDDFIWGDSHGGLCVLIHWLEKRKIPAVIEIPGSEAIEQYLRGILGIEEKCH